MSSPDAPAAPVFVLTTCRSGSTLLRFLFDSHPEFACPPESRVAAACGYLAATWSSLETAGSGRNRGRDDPIEVSGQAALAIRAAVGEAMGSYLHRRGKPRWCDKSFDSHEFAEVVAQVWPEAKFVILTRHCLDVVDSVIEVNPWSLTELSLESYAARYPGHSLAAVVDYWLTVTEANLGFAGRHPERCHLLRYEDLVAAPEDRLAEMFAYLGACPAPGISEDCFRVPHEREGAGDHKIWLTSEIRRDRVGGGRRVPVHLLPGPLATRLDTVLAKLGYQPPAPTERTAGLDQTRGGHDLAAGGLGLAGVAEALAKRLTGAPDPARVTARWPTVAGTSIVVCVDDDDGSHEAVSWSFGGDAHDRAETAPAGPVSLRGAAGTWLALLEGRSDIVAEITGGRLRLAGPGGRRPPAVLMHATAAMLGFASIIPPARTPRSERRS